jgi:hypothetical protein
LKTHISVNPNSLQVHPDALRRDQLNSKVPFDGLDEKPEDGAVVVANAAEANSEVFQWVRRRLP